MAPSDSKTGRITKKNIRKGSWTKEEDEKLAEYIESHGATKWKTVAMKSGLNRCEKSCRLRWLNYLRPNIKRGDFTDQEEDLIIRLHKLIGNRWSLIAGRIPGRTDNDIKNYWNSHLCKKKEEALSDCSTTQESESQIVEEHAEKTCIGSEELEPAFNFDEFFDKSERFSMPDWSCQFLELEDYLPNFP